PGHGDRRSSPRSRSAGDGLRVVEPEPGRKPGQRIGELPRTAGSLQRRAEGPTDFTYLRGDVQTERIDDADDDVLRVHVTAVVDHLDIELEGAVRGGRSGDRVSVDCEARRQRSVEKRPDDARSGAARRVERHRIRSRLEAVSDDRLD